MAARFCETLFSRTSRSRFIFFNFGVLFYAEDAINICLYVQLG